MATPRCRRTLDLYGQVERKLFADVSAGKSGGVVEARVPEAVRDTGADVQFAVRVSLEGKIASVREQQKLRLDEMARRIARAETQVAEAEQKGDWNAAHHKRRRLANLTHRRTVLEGDVTEGRVRLCFGSRRLWHKQHNLEGQRLRKPSRSGWPTGRKPAATSSSCWAAGMRPVAACSAWPV